MDERILKAILSSSETIAKNLEHSTDYKKLMEEDKFLPTSTDIFNALCTSMTNLLSYKVSKEAYQRYTVRLHVINILREWCKINDTLQSFKILRDQKQASVLIKNLLEKYLTDDILQNCESSNNLLPLASALICLTPTDSFYKYYLEKVLLKLAEFESCNQSRYLLCYAVQEKSKLNLNLSTIEGIYNSQRCPLIEEPLLNHFILSCDDFKKSNDANNLESIDLLNQLLDFASKSSHIFLLLCAFLKELSGQLDYAPKVVQFIQLTLKDIKDCCERQGKDILDLYPRNLHSLVILLRIESKYHTNDSVNTTLKALKDIYTDDKETVLTLLSHYPEWLNLFVTYLEPGDID